MSISKIINAFEIKANPYQPRIDFQDEQIMELAQSIKENGLIHPISVRKVDNGYEIVAGERRYRAMKLIGMTEIPAIVLEANEHQMAEMALVENIQRENLTAIEEAKAYLTVMNNTGLTQGQLALKMGKSQSSIANKIRLLNLCNEVQDAVVARKITERHARALLSEKEDVQKELLDRIINNKLNVAQVEKEVLKRKEPKKHKPIYKGITKNIKIGINTIKQAYAMILRSGGIDSTIDEYEDDNEYVITIKFKK